MKKLILLGGILGLAAVGIVGYSMQDDPPTEPLRFVYETKTGPVVFDHKLHAKGQAGECSRCHHLGTLLGFETDNGVVEFDHKAHGLSERFGLSCSDCHHLRKRLPFASSEGPVVFDHLTHRTSGDYDLGCGDCHHAREKDKPIRKCSVCHALGSENNEFVDEDAIHKTAVGVKCMECHEELLEKEGGCATCHGKENLTLVDRFPRCETCHEGDTPNNRFFKGGVHEGAVGAACTKCHSDKMDDDEKGCVFCHGELEHPIEQGPMNCHECHFEGSRYNDHLSEGHPIHGQCPGAKCVSCHSEEIRTKDCGFCHK